MTYILLADPDDFCCTAVVEALTVLGLPVKSVANPFTDPCHLSWQLDNERSTSLLFDENGQELAQSEISGVLVRTTRWLDWAGWEATDWSYTQSEMQAALLGWLWSLSCPVVNRYQAAIWYHPQSHILNWAPLLSRCGFPDLPMLVSNESEAVQDLGARSGAVYTPLTSSTQYLIATDGDWSGVAAMQQYTPVCLAIPHGPPRIACVVGGRVIWEGEPPTEAPALEDSMLRFSEVSGLDFAQLAFAPTHEGMRVIAVEPYPRLEAFGDGPQGEIVAELVRLLTGARQSVGRPLGLPIGGAA